MHNTRLQASTSGSSTVVLASENSLKRPFMDSDDVDSSAKKAFTEDISGSWLLVFIFDFAYNVGCKQCMFDCIHYLNFKSLLIAHFNTRHLFPKHARSVLASDYVYLLNKQYKSNHILFQLKLLTLVSCKKKSITPPWKKWSGIFQDFLQSYNVFIWVLGQSNLFLQKSGWKNFLFLKKIHYFWIGEWLPQNIKVERNWLREFTDLLITPWKTLEETTKWPWR